MLNLRIFWLTYLVGVGLSVNLPAQIISAALPSSGTGIGTTVPTAQVQKNRLVRRPTPPQEGFWVTETTPELSGRTLIHFYDDQQRLIRTDTLAQATINLRRPRVVRQLNRRLVAALQQPNHPGWLAGTKQP
jgi:hypothetical protein